MELRWVPLRISPDQRVGFSDSGVMDSRAETSATATCTADSSPVTEFYNAGLQKDYLFVGVTNNNVIEALHLLPATFANLQPLVLSRFVQFESRLRSPHLWNRHDGISVLCLNSGRLF
jgi:hypothetical protein